MEGDGLPYKEPYRATKLWMSCVSLFRKGIPLTKHRRQWKTFENSFSGSEAITWFNAQLQENFQLSITRKQTHQLLQKFYKAGIFVGASNRISTDSPSSRCEADFKDNARLYRLPNHNPVTETQIAESSETKENDSESVLQNQNYTVVIQPLTIEETHRIWEQSFTERFVQVVGYEVYSTFLKPEDVLGHRISHNMTKIGHYGIVMNQTGADELPLWLIHAMKCMANWPNNHTLDSSIPSYPGFEHDVYKLIRDYFELYKDTAPLLTHDLYDAFITTFIRAELFDFNTRVYGGNSALRASRQYPFNNLLGIHGHGTLSNPQEPYPFNASESVENLIMEMMTPVNPKTNPKIHPKTRRILGEESFNIVSDVENESFSLPKPMPKQAYTLSRYVPEFFRRPSPFFYETAFTTDKSPITRVVSKTELESSLGMLPKVLRPNSAPNVNLNARFAYENPTLTLSPADMINHPKYTRIRQAAELANNDLNELPSYSFLEATTPKRKVSPTTHSCKDFDFGREFEPSRKPERSRSAADLSDGAKDRSPYVPGGVTKRIKPSRFVDQYVNSPSRSARKTLDFYYGAEACVPGLMTPEGKELAIVSFRLLTLLLPAKNRRHLQLLLRCMAKMSKNEKLMLDVSMTTRAVVVNTFFRCILSCSDRSEFDELLALRIVTFLMDNDADIFDVTKEQENIVKRTEDAISQLQIVKIPAPPASKTLEVTKKDAEEPKFACHRITMNEYEDQRLLATTSKSLRDLLDAFDQTTDEKERKKRLKEFRQEYPHIYYEKYGDAEPLDGSMDSTSVPAEKKKPFRLLKFRF